MKNKKILSAMIAIVIVVATLPMIAFVSEQDRNIMNYENDSSMFYELVEEFGEQFMQNQDIAVNKANSIFDMFPSNRAGELVFPEYFGGMYIDSDGNLVVLITETHVEDIQSIDTIMLNMREDAINFVEFSYAELISVWKHIHYFLVDNWMDSECIVVANLASAGVRPSMNRVRVYLRDINDVHIELFNEAVINHPALYFVQYIEVYEEELYCEFYNVHEE